MNRPLLDLGIYLCGRTIGFRTDQGQGRPVPARPLKLELSEVKTLITHGRTQAAQLLAYEIVVMDADDKHDHRGHRRSG